MIGAIWRSLFGPKKPKPKPMLSREDRAVFDDVFARARVEPTDDDWQWAAHIWAQGARGPSLDRLLATRIAVREQSQ